MFIEHISFAATLCASYKHYKDKYDILSVSNSPQSVGDMTIKINKYIWHSDRYKRQVTCEITHTQKKTV